jgi:hypothetical protein
MMRTPYFNSTGPWARQIQVVLSALVSLMLLADGAFSADDPRLWSVQAFGAKADGTTDNTAAIQKALDEAAQAGGKVLVPPGRYLTSGTL